MLFRLEAVVYWFILIDDEINTPYQMEVSVSACHQLAQLNKR